MKGSEINFESTIPGILILTHGQVGEELIKSAEMIVGPINNICAISLMPGLEARFYSEVKQLVDCLPDGSLLISDVFGGTPANTSAALSKEKDIAAVSGLNLGMLLEALSSRESLQGENLAETVIAAGQQGCKNIMATLRDICRNDKEA